LLQWTIVKTVLINCISVNYNNAFYLHDEYYVCALLIQLFFSYSSKTWTFKIQHFSFIYMLLLSPVEINYKESFKFMWAAAVCTGRLIFILRQRSWIYGVCPEQQRSCYFHPSVRNSSRMNANLKRFHLEM